MALLAAAWLASAGMAQPLVRQLQRMAHSMQPGVVTENAPATTAEFEWMPPGELARALRAKIQDRAPILLGELVAALVVLTFFYLLQRAAVRILRGVLARTNAEPAATSIVVKLTRYLLLGVGVLTAMQQLGVQVTSLLAGVGIAGLAVGFAAQDTIANLIAGFTLLLEKPFRIGDSVTLAGTMGEVLDIGLRSTRLRTAEVRDAFLPNKEIINHLIVNHSMTPRLRLDLAISVGYSADLDRVRAVLLSTVAGDALIAEKPAPQVVVVALGDSGVNLELRFWLSTGLDQTGVRFLVLERAKKALDAAGIEIPSPQRVIRIEGGVPQSLPADLAR